MLRRHSDLVARFSRSFVILSLWFGRHKDFWLLLSLFIAFRLSSVAFQLPGGHIRDYSDLVYYQARAAWQDYGFLPYRDYWSEYPPLFPWLTVWIDRITRELPRWEDGRLWFSLVFGLFTTAAEAVILVALYRLGRRLYGDNGLRVAWLYAGLFLPVFFLSGWYDALPVAAIMLALAVLPGAAAGGAILFGLVVGVGGALKLVPLALLPVVPLAFKRWRDRLIATGAALAVVLGCYGLMYAIGPIMTRASLRSLIDRSGWSTISAWLNGFHSVGAVVGDVFDPQANISLYAERFPHWPILLTLIVLGSVFWVMALRQGPAPQPTRRVVGFAAVTYGLLLLAYPAWNPQYALYLLPFLILLWPNARGVFYVLGLSAVCLLEYPVYVNLIGAEAPELLLPIILVRTVLLLAITADLALYLFWPGTKIRRVAVGVAIMACVALAGAMPAFGHAYAAGQLQATWVRPLAQYLNSLSDDAPVVMHQQRLSRHLRPYLARNERLILAGGLPGRVDPLPELIQRGPFRYVQASDDPDDLLAYLKAQGVCEDPYSLDQWWIWSCNGAEHTPLAHFAEGIRLEMAQVPDRLPADGRLPLTLFWSAEQTPAHDYTVFVHVLDRDGQMVGQQDQAPAAGKAPTSGWVPGQLIADEYRIPVQTGSGDGPYRVYIGMYDPSTGTRLDVASPNPVSERRLLVQTIR